MMGELRCLSNNQRLSLVKVIEVDENSVRFWFGGEKENVEAVVIPLQEGETVLAQLRTHVLMF
jgi:hypothetical protein